MSNNTITELVLFSPATSARIDSLRQKFALPPTRSQLLAFLIEVALDQLAAQADEIRRNSDKHDRYVPGNRHATLSTSD